MKTNLTCTCLSLLLICSVVLAAPTIKGNADYKEHDKIILVADGVTKGSQVIWDVDGDAQVEEGDGKLYVWAKPGQYRVVMTAVDFDAKKITRARFTFTVIPLTPPKPPDPPIPPKPPIPPDPPTPPAPIPVDGLHVLIVEDRANRVKLPKDQAAVITDVSIRQYLRSHCAKDAYADNGSGYRIWDDKDDPSEDGQVWKAAMQRPRKSLPWIVISNGKTGYEGPLPGSVADTLSLLKKYGGD